MGQELQRDFQPYSASARIAARARKLGGKNIRTRASLGVDEELLIDFSQDTYSHCLYGGLDLTKIRHVQITHSHSDHFCPADIANILPPHGGHRAGQNLARIWKCYGDGPAGQHTEAIPGVSRKNASASDQSFRPVCSGGV